MPGWAVALLQYLLPVLADLLVSQIRQWQATGADTDQTRTTLLRAVQSAEAQPGWTGEQKRAYVVGVMRDYAARFAPTLTPAAINSLVEAATAHLRYAQQPDGGQPE